MIVRSCEDHDVWNSIVLFRSTKKKNYCFNRIRENSNSYSSNQSGYNQLILGILLGKNTFKGTTSLNSIHKTAPQEDFLLLQQQD